MRNEEYEKLYNHEENHWWFKGTRKILFTLLNKFEKRENLKVLDAGCGTGIIVKNLEKYGEAQGIDISDEAIKFCKERNINVEKGSVEELPFEDNTFDLITSIDVIYHKWVNDDKKALQEINRTLKPDGRLLIQVASYNFMKSNHDEAVFTERRYTKKQLRNLLEQSGFKIEKITYSNTILFPIALIKRLTEKKKQESEVKPVSNLTNKILTKVLNFEAKLLKNINFPFGLSIIAIVKK